MKQIKYVFAIIVLITIYVSCDTDNLSDQKKILTFEINSIIGVINEVDYTIDVDLPYGTDVTSLKPIVTISEKASIYPQSVKGFNFSTPITFIVTAEDASNQGYKVTVLTDDKQP